MFNNINMNFFNVQFLILIAIIIVIYFLYKEINFIHKKINKLQVSIDNKNNSNKIDQIIKGVTNNVDVESSTESSNHIAIYSNDNETSSTSSTHPNENKPEIIIKSEQIINEKPVTNQNDEIVIQIFNESVNKQVDESANKQVDESANKQVDESANKQFDESANESVEETVNEIVNISVKTNIELNKDSLEKMKLPDLKKIAEDKHVTLSKKINGVQKSKNKKELIDEILNKL
jgi:hypothetical protein